MNKYDHFEYKHIYKIRVQIEFDLCHVSLTADLEEENTGSKVTLSGFGFWLWYFLAL